MITSPEAAVERQSVIHLSTVLSSARDRAPVARVAALSQRDGRFYKFEPGLIALVELGGATATARRISPPH